MNRFCASGATLDYGPSKPAISTYADSFLFLFSSSFSTYYHFFFLFSPCGALSFTVSGVDDPANVIILVYAPYTDVASMPVAVFVETIVHGMGLLQTWIFFR
jgi:hypothetical protein